MPGAGRSWAASVGSYGDRSEPALRQINGGRLARVEWGDAPLDGPAAHRAAGTRERHAGDREVAAGGPSRPSAGRRCQIPGRPASAWPLEDHPRRRARHRRHVARRGAHRLSAAVGALVGVLAMAGDLLSSFVKRRLGLIASSRATGLDQIPEALLPLVACGAVLPLTPADIAAGVAIFFVGEVVLSRLLYELRIRDRPY